MKNATFMKIAVLCAVCCCLTAACQTQNKTATNDADNSTVASANTNAAAGTRSEATPKTSTNTAVEPEKTGTEKPSGGSLATPTEAYKTAYAARKNKDIAALKRVMSKDALEFMEMLVEPGKSVDDALLRMTETPQAATDQTRSEKITGDKATLEYPDANGSWKTLDLTKENGEWKLTMPKADSSSAPGKSK